MAGFTRSLDSSEAESRGNSPSSSQTPESNEKPVKRRASRAGTRSVSTLTPAQLSRKRANDREAQRAIRQRTKEHIEKLELRIAELESSCDISSSTRIDEILLRNAVLEAQTAHLKRQLQLTRNSYNYAAQNQYDQADIPPVSQWQSNTIGPAINESVSKCEPLATSGYINPGMTTSPYSPTPLQIPLTPVASPAFVGTSVGNGMCTVAGAPSEIGSPNDWASMSTAMEQTSSSAICTPLPRSTPNFPLSSPISIRSSAYRQPDMYSWEIPTKLAAATSPIDGLLLSLLKNKRTLAMNGIPRSQMLGSSYPNMKSLIYDDPEIQNSTHPVSKAISDILRNSLILDLPERVANFYCMYYFLQWQISPSPETYNNLPEFYQPRPSQHVTPHAIWVDFVAWPKLREKIIDNRELYQTDEFQEYYMTSVNVNWPFRDLDVLEVVGDGPTSEVRASEQFRRYLLNLDNWSLDAAFARRFPELEDACRFTDARSSERGSNGQASPAGRLS